MRLTRTPQGEKVFFFYDDDGKLAAGPESQIPSHLLPEDPDEYATILLVFFFHPLTNPALRFCSPDVICASLLPVFRPTLNSIHTFDIDNPVNHFPVYEPDAARVTEIEKEFAEENDPLNIHYDASKEVRAKGAGFYQFSADEETRRRQMEELKTAREETGKTRAEFGALDLKPGEVEGMNTDGGAGGTSKSAVLEKRKRDLEERRKLVEAKRRRKIGDPPVTEPPPNPSGPAGRNQDAAHAAEHPSTSESVGAVASNPADDFLAQLERDIMSGKAR